mgnify:CR=1 FL=1
MKNEKKDYYLGLDMGTNSVGWAITDSEYRLLRFRRQDMWGVREFEEAKGTIERRSHRTARRRRQRHQVRIGLIKSYFDNEICKIDPNFFIRLENSKYFADDKDAVLKSKNSIFDDLNYKDADYFKEYPTVYHLRSELIHNKSAHDVRLVYLAVLNLFKHRGHFLNFSLSTQSGESGFRDTKKIYDEIRSELQEFYDIMLPASIDYEALEDILAARNYSRTKKSEMIVAMLQLTKKEKQANTVIKCLCGRKIRTSDLLVDATKEESVEICFAEAGYEGKEEKIVNVLGEDRFRIIVLLKELFDKASLKEILMGETYLSDARILKYEKHEYDLKVLKSIFKKYATKVEYNEMFRMGEKGTYSAYVNSFNSGSKQRRNYKDRTVEMFYKSVKRYLNRWDNTDEEIQYVLKEIEKENFMPKQLTASNGVIPNQVHAKELHKILENASKYLPFLNEIDDSKLMVKERIEQLFQFQIPYYVGPTTEKSQVYGGNGWVVRKKEGQVLPWKMDELIDMTKTREEFITKLIRNCTYLNGEKVMPKSSMLYEKFCVLNEINNIKIDEEPIDVSLKKEIYDDLYKKGKKVTKSKLMKYLICKGYIKDSAQVTGIDVNLNNYLGTYGKFKDLFGEDIEKDEYKKMAEEIVYLLTIFGDSKDYIHKSLEEKYALSDQQIKRILGFKFKDWARFSREFLEINACDKKTGEMVTLISALWNTNYNLMELLHSTEYTFNEVLEEKTKKSLTTLSEFQPDDLNEMYFSAPVKRMIWQTLLIIKEVEKIMGCAPKRIFIEMTRQEDDKKERKDSRGKKLIELYKNIKDEDRDWKSEIEEADKGGNLRSKKLFLYYTQMGKDMYTGKEIDLHELLHNNIYDIDHIYPKHFVKDDNISNNLVLVDKRKNNHKQDKFPIEEDIRKKCWNHWKFLREKGLITEEKYHRLTRTSDLSDDEKAKFIARQLVETSQATKGIADLLKELLQPQGTTVVYAKASNVSRFRQQNGFIKSRLVNDFHHANDAYLNIVVGNAYFVKFTQNPMNFIRNEYSKDAVKYNYNLNKMFDKDITRGEEIAWIASKNEREKSGTICTVIEMMNKNTPILTRLSFTGHGSIANKILCSAKAAKKENYISLKSSDNKLNDVTKYGGSTSVATAYFIVVEHEKKNKLIRTIETVPIYLADQIEKNPELLEEYCKNILKLINPRVCVRKIKMQSLLKRNGYYAHITGCTGKQYYLKNAVNLCLCQEWVTYIKKVEKYIDKKVLDDLISKEKNIELYDVLVDKHNNTIYKNRPNPVGEKLQGLRKDFEILKIEEQALVLGQILNFSAIILPKANLTLLGESANTGIALMGKDISNLDELILINQSVTGLYSRKVDLLKV